MRTKTENPTPFLTPRGAAAGRRRAAPALPALALAAAFSALLGLVPGAGAPPLAGAEFDWDDFSGAEAQLALVGTAAVKNRFPAVSQPADRDRLSLTDNGGQQQGSAWYRTKMNLLDGFSTTFDLHFTEAGGSGADGISFVVHDHPMGLGLSVGEEGAGQDALTIKFDSYQNNGDPSPAVVQVKAGASVLSTVNLATFPGITTVSGGDLSNSGGSAAPYRVEIDYAPGSLDVTFDGVPIISNLDVDLASTGATDASGLSYVGFGARTGGLAENHDVTRWTLAGTTPVVFAEPTLSEFMADNGGTLDDEDGDSSDWIEIYNGTAGPVDFGGWHLTDDPAVLNKWTLPALTLGSGRALVIFASGKDRLSAGVGVGGGISTLHTNFRLQDAGDYLALVRPDGVTVVKEYAPTFPPQRKDISYGTLGEEPVDGYFTAPTPGVANRGPQGLRAGKVTFSRDGGLVRDNFSLTLTTESPDAIIRYTTDGSNPTEGSARHLLPISINASTEVRARAYEDGFLPGKLKGERYLKMDAALAAFTSNLPVVVIDSYGFNIDSEASANSGGPRRPVYSVFIDTDPATGRAATLGAPDYAGFGAMNVRGQTSSGFPKKQYRFEARTDEDNDKMIPLLGMPEDDDWVIHAPYSDKTLMRNVLAYGWSAEMGHYSPRTRFVELFYNSGSTLNMGDYRGVYVVMENIKRGGDRVDIARLSQDENSAPDVEGGYIFKKDKRVDDNPRVVTDREGHTLEIVYPKAPTPAQTTYLDNYLDTFEAVLHGPGFADPDTGYANYIDVDSFIDVHLLVEITKQIDGYRLSSHFYKDKGGKMVSGPVWDYNLSLGNANYLAGQNPSGWYHAGGNPNNYPWYGRLFQDPEFALRYQDRWFELRRGIFATDRLTARIDAHFDLLEQEAAGRNFQEWSNLLGRYTWPNADGYQNRTTYRSEVDWMRNWLVQRVAWMDSQFTAPPGFSHPGGAFPAGGSLTITAATPGTVFYTTDGSDPRVPGEGAANTLVAEGAPARAFVPSVLNGGSILGTRWTGSALNEPFDDGVWGAGTTGVGYERTPDAYGALIGLDVSSMDGGNPSVFVRVPFTAPAQGVIDTFTQLTLQMKYDDGFVAYLNGAEVTSANRPADLAWNAAASADHPDSAAVNFIDFDLTAHIDKLRPGANILALHGLNQSSGSSDLLLVPRLTFATGAGGGDDPTLSPGARAYAGPVTLDATTTVRARTRNGATWSAINEATYLVGALAGPSNLVISKIHFRPAPATVEEADAGFDSRGDFEFIELLNTSGGDIDLTGAAFVEGIGFRFEEGGDHRLAPGGRILVVSNLAAFALRYPEVPAGAVAGQFTGALDNGGERLHLVSSTGQTIADFTYGDAAPWPEAPDGDGPALVLRDPGAGGPLDPADPASWRRSAYRGGSPGVRDGERLAAWLQARGFGQPGEDDDGDGISNLLAYALGRDLLPARAAPRDTLPRLAPRRMEVDGVMENYLTISFRRRFGAEGLTYITEVSDDLVTWRRDPGDGSVTAELEAADNGDGTETLTVRDALPLAPDSLRYLRVYLRAE